jgi:hypothetical protein
MKPYIYLIVIFAATSAMAFPKEFNCRTVNDGFSFTVGKLISHHSHLTRTPAGYSQDIYQGVYHPIDSAQQNITITYTQSISDSLYIAFDKDATRRTILLRYDEFLSSDSRDIYQGKIESVEVQDDVQVQCFADLSSNPPIHHPVH